MQTNPSEIRQELENALSKSNLPLPKNAIKCFSASLSRGRLLARIHYLRGLDRINQGQVFAVLGKPTVLVRFINSVFADGPDITANCPKVVLLEPIDCESEDLQDVFLVSDEIYAPADEVRSGK